LAVAELNNQIAPNLWDLNNELASLLQGPDIAAQRGIRAKVQE
jgi:hypothetical protein